MKTIGLWYLFLSFPWFWTPSQCCWRGLCYLSMYNRGFAYCSWNIEKEDKTPVFIGTTDLFAEIINIYDQSMANTVTKYISETIKFCALKRWGCLPNRDCSYTCTLKCLQTHLEFWPRKVLLQRNCYSSGNLLTQQGQCFFEL